MQKKCVYLRRADSDDVELFFKWANEPAVRANSFNMEPILWENHKTWFGKVLADGGTCMYVLMEDNLPVGQVRLALKDSKWQVSYSIDVSYRGRGYGKIILHLAENELARDGHVGETLFAEVKTDNIASQRIFVKQGYREVVSEHSNAYAYVKVISKGAIK